MKTEDGEEKYKMEYPYKYFIKKSFINGRQ